MATTAQTSKKKATVKVRAEYPFCDVPVGDTQTIWGVDFVHEEVTQKDEVFHILTAELPAEQAEEMAACGRVAKA